MAWIEIQTPNFLVIVLLKMVLLKTMSGERICYRDYVICSYQECNDIIDAYSRAIAKYGLLSETDGTQKRSDGTPVIV